MNIPQLRAFVAVADAGGFTAAAEALGITQSGVSHAVAALEADLGARLFLRGRDGVTVSDAGRRVLPHAREVLAREERIRREGAAAAALETGKVRLGSFPSVSTRILPGVLAAFRRRYPGVEVVVFEGTDPEVRGWIAARTVDAGVVTLPLPPAAGEEGIEALPLAADDFLVALPAAHPLAAAPGLAVGRLAAEPFILSRSGCEATIHDLFAAAGVALRPRFEVLDMGTILAMVREGVGLTILPALALPPDAPGVRAVPIVPRVRRQLALGVRSPASLPPATAAFVAEARAWAEAHGYAPALG